MDVTNFTSLVLQILILWVSTQFLLLVLKRSRFYPKRLPPGPFPLPIFGNLFSLTSKPHKTLADLARLYGPIFTLQLGYKTAVVISSTSLAKVVLQNQESSFSSRDIIESLQVLDRHACSVGFLNTGPKWKILRKICATHIFSSSSLESSRKIRSDKVRQLISYIQDSCSIVEQGATDETTPAIDIGQMGFTSMLNLLSSTFFSVDLVGPDSDLDESEFKEVVWNILELMGAPNLADFFPVFKPFDPQGIKRRMRKHLLRIFEIFDKVIDQRSKSRDGTNSTNNNGGEVAKDVLDALLNIHQENSEEFSLVDLRILLLDLFIAGTDTTSSTIEWAMSELLVYPEKLIKAQAELQQVIGKGNPVEESNISKLPYLQAIIKETLRLHPPGPFLIPRKADNEVELGGFTIPKNAQVFVNIWAIGRDSSLWEKPDLFEPERFMLQGSSSNIDYKGQHFELIPFGAGRRICAGLPLAHRMLHLIVGSLIHSFDWKLEDGVTPEEMDMEEKISAAMRKAKPLRAIPITKVQIE